MAMGEQTEDSNVENALSKQCFSSIRWGCCCLGSLNNLGGMQKGDKQPYLEERNSGVRRNHSLSLLSYHGLWSRRFCLTPQGKQHWRSSCGALAQLLWGEGVVPLPGRWCSLPLYVQAPEKTRLLCPTLLWASLKSRYQTRLSEAELDSWISLSLSASKGCKCGVQFADPNSHSKGVSHTHAGEGVKSTHVRDSNAVLASHFQIRSCWLCQCDTKSLLG